MNTQNSQYQPWSPQGNSGTWGPANRSVPPMQRTPTGQLAPHHGPPMQRTPTGQLAPHYGPPMQRTPTGQLAPRFSPPPQRPKRSNNVLLIVLTVCALVIGGASVIGLILSQNMPGLPGNEGTASTLTPDTQTTPTPSAHEQAKLKAQQYVAQMSLEDMITQLIFVDNRATTDQLDLDYMVSEQHIGGILMASDRLLTIADVQNDVARWQGSINTPLFMATEDEGGWVMRLNNIYPERPPSASEIGASGDPALATSEGKLMGQRLAGLNLNTSFTPVIDVGSEGGYMSNDERTFGFSADDVITYGGSYLAAMQQEGIVASLKHFPGIGRVPIGADPHYVLPELSVTREEYYQTDMEPFKRLIQSENELEHPGFIMMTYVMVPSIDPNYPAQYSSIFVQDILREEFGYDGVIITDALIMFGSQINGVMLTLEEATIAALTAGNDMLLGISNSDQVQEVINTVETAIANGTLTEERIKESATRVITLKIERGIITQDAPGV